MTASVRRRASFSRALLALGGMAVLALLALAALLLGSALADQAPQPTGAAEVHAASTSAVGATDHAPATIHAIHQQLSTHARGAAFAVLTAAVAVAAWVFLRLRLRRAGRLRTLRIAGLPPGRAPPTFRIA
jgi:hypothetical protein